MKAKIIPALAAAVVTVSCMSINTYADKLTTRDGLKYVVSDSGEEKGLYTGWAKSGDNKYYYKNGVMKKDCWLNSKGTRKYLIREDGTLAKGWVLIDNRWHYFDETTGVHAVKPTKIYGKTYNFSSDGVWDGILNFEDSDHANFTLQENLSKDDHGGIYFDKSALIVRSVNDDAVTKQTEALKSTFAPIIVIPCKYSMNELESVKAHLDKNVKEYGIKSLSIDMINNCVFVKLDKSSSKLDKYIKSLNNSDIVYVQYGEVYVDIIDD